MDLRPMSPDITVTDIGNVYIEEEHQEYQDPIDALANAFLDAAKIQWTKQELNRVLFCRIGDIKQFKKWYDKLGKSAVFLKSNIKDFCGASTRHNYDIHVPVVYVSFCGYIVRAQIDGDFNWFEIRDCSGEISCRADSVSLSDLEDIRKQYYDSHQVYRDKEKLKGKEAIKQSCILWQLNRRSKEIAEKLTEVQVSDVDLIKNRKVMVIGKLWEEKHHRFVIIKQCSFIEDKKEKRFSDMMDLERLY